MQTLKLTAQHFKKTDSYYKEYIGDVDVSDYQGNIEIDANLGWVKFESIKASGSIVALAGTGIEAGDGIEAGYGIEAGLGIQAGDGIEAGAGIKAGWGIKAGAGIQAGMGIQAGTGIKAGDGIEAGLGIQAGTGIKAGWSIEAGAGIKAGTGIEAGMGIQAGLSIVCKLSLKATHLIFAGICTWRMTTDADKTITCGKLEGGTIAYGILKEIGLPENDATKEAIELLQKNGYKIVKE